MSSRTLPWHRRLAGPMALVAILVSGPIAGAEGYTPEEARARMVLPEGFAAQVFAAEPMIRQPVAAAFDERGRMWVVEYLQYPNPEGLKPVTVDVYLRTEYDRVPEPPPKGPKGADRVVILEDTDGDGKADKKTVFVEGLNLASAVAVGHGGVFVGQAPYLLFYPDRNRDDVPDGDPEVLLSGFGLQDAHAVVNSLTWGPDGWLYGAQGSTVTAKIRGVEFQQGIWRYHPITRAFELFAEGGGNTWGLDFDRQGHAFGSSNGSFIAFHMVPGGYYWKGFAKHGPLHNPRTYGYFDSIAYDGPKVGGHVTPGGILYKADAYPEEFRGAFLGGNLLSNAVYWHKLSPRGSTFSGRHGGTLIDAKDRWFRPIDLLTGPDGCVHVVDWYDRRASHLNPVDNWDRTNGRIYRITYRDTKPVKPGDLSKLSSAELVGFRDHPNDWYSDTARRILAERRDPSVIPGLQESLPKERDPTKALRDLWALHVSGGLDDATALLLLDHPVAGVRRWTVRLLGDRWLSGSLVEGGRWSRDLTRRLAELAANEPDPGVRSALASLCSRGDRDLALPVLGNLIRRGEDTDDPHIPLLIWWAIERSMSQGTARSMAHLVGSSDNQRLPMVRAHLLERTARALVDLPPPASPRFELIAPMLRDAPTEEDRERIVAGLDKGLEGRSFEAVPGPLEDILPTLLAGERPSAARLRLAIRLGDPSAREKAVARLRGPATSDAERLALIDILGRFGGAEEARILLDLAGQPGPRPTRLAALNALAGRPEPEFASSLIAIYGGLDDGLKDRVREALVARPGWAGLLIEAMKAGTIPPKELKATQAQKIARLGDAALTARLEAAWGKVPGADLEAKARRIAEVRGMLVEGDKGDASRGQAVFTQACAGCHRLFDEGVNIGPELTGAERTLDFLLESLVHPSGVIRKEYQAQTLALADGRVLSGLVVEESEAAVTLFDGQQQKTVIPKSSIESSRIADVSLMPEGVLDNLTEAQVRDLFRYLQSPGPPRR